MLVFIIAAVLILVVVCVITRSVAPAYPSQPPFIPSDELVNLLKRQPLEDRIRYLGLSDASQLYDNYKMCLTEDELQWLPDAIREERNIQQQYAHQDTTHQYIPYDDDNYNRSEFSWSRQKPIEYDDDDTYDNFHMQHEEELKELWGKDDYEDAIEDAWEDHQRDKQLRKR